MAAELLLHAKKEDYLNLIEQLDGKFNELVGLLADYRTLKNDVNNFVKDSDSNFQAMQENVEANIEAVRKALAFVQTSKNNLQKTVDQMDEASGNINQLIQEGADFAKNTIRAAITLEGLGI